ncbi:MAG: hypothetical protein CVV45_02030 [Spirochaetae bacterium HGW-Spirochaetae-10]|nr:MAG: hypothetical protein CVV45_02030 [Spirochaetae bacterium HGW-Spirochaetae-10]
MPGCYYYGTISDHTEILRFLFERDECEIYESYSEYERPLRRFRSIEAILLEFEDQKKHGKENQVVSLRLYVKKAGPGFAPMRVSLDPEKCGGASYRYAASGWGLVQFHLSDSKTDLESSHTNHNSLNRANKWSPTYPDLGSPSEWDFRMINRFSQGLIRQIKKRAVASLESRAVLSGALNLWQHGYKLLPFDPQNDKITVRREIDCSRD